MAKRGVIFFLFFVFLLVQMVFAEEDFSVYNGKIIERIEFSPMRVSEEVLRRKLPIKEGDIFNDKKYQKAQKSLHDMRIFKELSFQTINQEEDKIIIKITGQDGYYFFPLAFVMGGAKKGVAATIFAGNILKQGETFFLSSGFGEDGESVSFGSSFINSFMLMKFENLNFNRRFYDGNWSSTFGIFETAQDEDDFSNPLFANYNKQDKFSFLFLRKFDDLSIFIQPEYEYIYTTPSLDNGRHSHLTLGISYQKNKRAGANMGALLGYGLSDKKEALRDLNHYEDSFVTRVAFSRGSNWTGSDYSISKLFLSAEVAREFRNRNLLMMYLNGIDSFHSPFSNKVRTLELMNVYGRYSRQRLGTRGIGGGVTYVYYLLRNNLGLLSANPFYEFATVYDEGHYYNQSGVGGTVSYKFWRFPIPLGLNYTYNINDYSHQISFMAGAKF